MKRWRILAGPLFLLAILLPATVFAQGTISGTISASTGDPIAGARVNVAGSSNAATSDEQGRFTLTNVNGTTVSIEVRKIGYKLGRTNARVGDDNVRISMTATV